MHSDDEDDDDDDDDDNERNGYAVNETQEEEKSFDTQTDANIL